MPAAPARAKLFRTIGALVAGALLAVLLIAAIEAGENALYPVASLGVSDPTDYGQIVERAPVAAKLLLVFAWFAGATAGSALAAFIARRSLPGWAIAGLVLAGGVANIVSIPHPLWMQVAAVLAPLAGGAVGIGIARRLLAARTAP